MRFLGWFAQWSTNDPIKIIEPFPTAAAIEPLVVNTQATSPSAGSGWSFGGKRLVCVLLNRPVLISVIILGMTAFARADYMQVTGNPVNKQLLSDPDPFAYVYDTYEVTINGVTKNIQLGVCKCDNAITKATNLVRAINDEQYGFGPGSAMQMLDVHGNPTGAVIIKGNGSHSLLEAKNNASGEASGGAQVSLIPSGQLFPYVALFDAIGAITGNDFNGAESVFSASFGFDGLSANFNETFSSLSTPTVDGLLLDMYSQFMAELPLSLQNDLQLDLNNQTLLFAFPQGQQHYFVSFASTDETLMTGSGIESTPSVSTPEPSSLLLFGTGLLGLVVLAARKKPSRPRPPADGVALVFDCH